MLTDTHTHLYWPDFQSDLNQVIDRSIHADVTRAIVVGVDTETSQQALEFVQTNQFDNFQTYASVGIHPHETPKYLNADESIQEDIDILRKIYTSNPKQVVAIGECGLDFLFDPNQMDITPNPRPFDNDTLKNIQRTLFKAQIDLAEELKLPIIVHVRDDRSQNPDNTECWDEALSLLKTSSGILHCYSGNQQITQDALQLNFLISFAANITYPKNEYLRKAIKQIPLEKIVLETDCPFLAPQTRRGRRNEPSAILDVAKAVAEIKNISLETVAAQTTLNATTLLKL